MKHLRTYENNFSDLKIGDYIIVYFDVDKNYKETVKIVGFTDNRRYKYKILMDNGDPFYISKDEVDRYSTPKEIEKFELSINSKKYNI